MRTIKLCLLFFCIHVFLVGTAFSADKKKKRKKEKVNQQVVPDSNNKKEDKSPYKSLEDVVKKTIKFEGLFTIYQDSLTGKSYLNIKKNQIGQSFIYFSVAMDGSPLISGLFRGAYRYNYIFAIERHFDKILIVQKNTAYTFDKNSALHRAADANIPRTVMYDAKIYAVDKSKENYLIEANGLFLSEALDQVKPSPPAQRPKGPSKRPSLGGLSKNKTRYVEIKNYPQNTDIVVEYVYEKGSNVWSAYHRSIADQRNISVKVQHSFIALPENDYEVRYDDPRVGYFISQVTDLTSTSSTPYKDLIHRWHLKKKNPDAELSEPVEPITWWIENTTPVEFREVIKEGVLEWNKAFEKAGFKDAMVVKIQSDTATWDAGDIRYNVLRWTSSPTPPFGGYGPSFVNPLTGQILGADIMLEFVHFTNRVKYTKLYETQSNGLEEELTDTPGKTNNFKGTNTYSCSYSNMLQQELLFGNLRALANDLDLESLKKEAMLELIMHEIGHTLGLNHNMKASQLFSPQELSSPEIIAGKALSASVMDYVAINVTKDRKKQGAYYSPTIGDYDIWAIEYGYTPVDETGLKNILERSTEKTLAFGNDADDMRSPGLGIDPRIMIGDLSNDAITYSIERLELVDEMVKDLKEKYNQAGQSYEDLIIAFSILSRQQRQAARVISRYIGGIYLDRAFIGQKNAQQPFTPVPYQEQKSAMNALAKHIFGKTAFQVPQELYTHLQKQRRGFNHYGHPEDPRLHNRVLAIQKDVLRHLLHRETLRKIIDSELYGNKYSLAKFMTDLNRAIFNSDIRSSVNTFRQNLQIEYTNYLITIYKSNQGFPNHAKAMAYLNLTEIIKLANAGGGDISNKAHKLYLKKIIEDAFKK